VSITNVNNYSTTPLYQNPNLSPQARELIRAQGITNRNGLTDEQIEARVLRREVLGQLDFDLGMVTAVNSHRLNQAPTQMPTLQNDPIMQQIQQILQELQEDAEPNSHRARFISQWLSDLQNGTSNFLSFAIGIDTTV